MEEWNELEFNNIERERDSFMLRQIKISNIFSNSDLNIGQIISSSIEINNNKMTITINYVDKDLKNNTDVSDIEVNENILRDLEKIDLRDINNNYIYEDNGSYWSIEYNNIFKICGDFINTDIYDKVTDIVNYKSIIDNRLKEINGG